LGSQAPVNARLPEVSGLWRRQDAGPRRRFGRQAGRRLPSAERGAREV